MSILSPCCPFSSVATVLLRMLVVIVGVAGIRHSAHARDWWALDSPSPGGAHSIGSPTAGCLRGGVALPLEGPGYQVVRASRGRYFGHPRLIRYIRALGQKIATSRLSSVYVGDLSQPRGGPMAYGHASHQNGLDVDIWLTPGRPLLRPAALREEVTVPPVVIENGTALIPHLWTSGHANLLHLAAGMPEVDRIFVHPVIKRELCRSSSNRAWLRKIRPWRGHSAHFHVRLTCGDTEDEACLSSRPL
ncbi:MAG: penicillin-insensitive murein endopeptidase, partial [Rhodospirillaceae bacterium]